MVFRVLIMIVAVPLLSLGQHLSGEVEFTQDQKGRQAYDLYLFSKVKGVDLLGRYFNVEKTGPRRGEFAAGKSFAIRDRVTIVPFGGITTDKAVFTPVVFAVKIAGRSAVYVADRKFYRGIRPDTLWQEASTGINANGSWQARWEQLLIISKATALNRFGIERRFGGQKKYFHVSPFVDTANRQAGFYSGFRWR